MEPRKRGRGDAADTPIVLGDEEEDVQPAATQPRVTPPPAPPPPAAAPPLPFQLEERRGDLFTADAGVSLAHCVARDLRLGKGIAKEFRERFGGIEEMRLQGVPIGGVAALRRGERRVYALVTKERSSGSYPTLDSLRAAVRALRARCARDGVTRLAMPRLGCGLDKLQWSDVRALLETEFQGSGVRVTVYTWP